MVWPLGGFIVWVKLVQKLGGAHFQISFVLFSFLSFMIFCAFFDGKGYPFSERRDLGKTNPFLFRFYLGVFSVRIWFGICTDDFVP